MAITHRAPTSGTRHGTGAGWGGPAKGAGWGGPATGTHVLPATGPGDPHWPRMTLAEKADLKQRRADALADRLYYLALRGPDQETQLRACVALHGIYNGSPVSRGLIAGADPDALMTADDIRAESAGLQDQRALPQVEGAEGEGCDPAMLPE